MPDIIRAWKDEEYFNSLSQEQKAQVPDNPAGAIELSDGEMETFVGGIKFTGGATGINDTRCSAVDACPSYRGCHYSLNLRPCMTP
jgi:mersacidin/lichenicidin family type 2 lantibiotic